MATVNEYSGSFNSAFGLARRNGDKQFKWNGRLYGTELADEYSKASTTNVKKGNLKDRSIKNVKTGLRYTILNENGLYIAYDNETGRTIGLPSKNPKDIENFMRSNLFSDAAGEVQITTNYSKIDRDTPGFLPVDTRNDLLGKDGQTRVYLKIGDDQLYYVVDNYNRIIGKSMDKRASSPNFNAWMKADGSQSDLNLRQAVSAEREATKNEVNLLEKLKLQRQDEQSIKDIRNGVNNFARGAINLTNSGFNLPNHAISGLVRTVTSPEYSLGDYVQGFNPKNMVDGATTLTIGLGDIAEIENPTARFALNFVNPMSVYGGTRANVTKSLGKGVTVTAPTHRADAVTYQTKVTGNARPVNVERMNIHLRTAPGGKSLFIDNVQNAPKTTLVLGGEPLTYTGLTWKPITAGTRSVSGNFSTVQPTSKGWQVTTTGPAARTLNTGTTVATYERTPTYQEHITAIPREAGVRSFYIPGETYMKVAFTGQPVFSNKVVMPYLSSNSSEQTLPVAPTVLDYAGGSQNNAWNTRILTGDLPYYDSNEEWIPSKRKKESGRVNVTDRKGHNFVDAGGEIVNKASSSSQYPGTYKL